MDATLALGRIRNRINGAPLKIWLNNGAAEVLAFNPQGKVVYRGYHQRLILDFPTTIEGSHIETVSVRIPTNGEHPHP